MFALEHNLAYLAGASTQHQLRPPCFPPSGGDRGGRLQQVDVHVVEVEAIVQLGHYLTQELIGVEDGVDLSSQVGGPHLLGDITTYAYQPCDLPTAVPDRYFSG